jgi:hypothetical protein
MQHGLNRLLLSLAATSRPRSNAETEGSGCDAPAAGDVEICGAPMADQLPARAFVTAACEKDTSLGAASSAPLGPFGVRSGMAAIQVQQAAALSDAAVSGV